MTSATGIDYYALDQAQDGLAGRLALLGLFPRDYSFTFDEALGAWGSPRPGRTADRRSLGALLDRGYLEAGPGGTDVFVMPASVRGQLQAYLEQHLSLRAEGTYRLVTYYAGVAAGHAAGAPADLAAIGQVYEAAGAAIGWAAQSKRWNEVVVLARALAPYFARRGLTTRYSEVLQQGLAAALRSDRRADQAWFLREQGALASREGQGADAAGLFEQSMLLYRSLGDRVGEARSLHAWGRAEARSGRDDVARRLLDDSLELVRAGQDVLLEPIVLHDRAELALRRGDYAAAQQDLEAALAAEVNQGDRAAQAATRYTLGQLAADRGQAQQAADHLVDCVVLARQIPDPGLGGKALAALGLVAAVAGAQATATSCWLAAQHLLETAGSLEAAQVDRALDHHLGAQRVDLPPDATTAALAQWWGR